MRIYIYISVYIYIYTHYFIMFNKSDASVNTMSTLVGENMSQREVLVPGMIFPGGNWIPSTLTWLSFLWYFSAECRYSWLLMMMSGVNVGLQSIFPKIGDMKWN